VSGEIKLQLYATLWHLWRFP